MGKTGFLRNLNNRRTVKLILLVKKLLGLVEMTFGLVNASFNLPEWQAVNIFSLHAEYNNFTISVECMFTN